MKTVQIKRLARDCPRFEVFEYYGVPGDGLMRCNMCYFSGRKGRCRLEGRHRIGKVRPMATKAP